MSTPRRDWLPEAILLIAVAIVATVVFAVAASSVLEVTARTASIDILIGDQPATRMLVEGELHGAETHRRASRARQHSCDRRHAKPRR
jgi:hypothetical protein